MHEQNSFSNLNTPTGKEPIISSGAVPSASISSNTNSTKPKKSLGLGVVILAILITAVVTAGAVWFFTRPQSEPEGETVPITYSSPDNDGTQAIEDTTRAFDQEIAAAKTNEEELNLKLNKAGYFLILEDYDSAIDQLNAIDLSSLSAFDQYRVYNHLASAYDGKNDTAQANNYRSLATEAQARDMASAQ